VLPADDAWPASLFCCPEVIADLNKEEKEAGI
jgi:hypothetical protein